MTAAPWSLSVVQAAELIKTKRLKPSELAESALERYRVVEPLVHAFVSVDEDRVMRDAKAQDGHSGGPLHGIPVAIKDIFDINGSKTGCGSKAMQDAPPATRDSAAVARLRAAGAIIFGKTTTHELACGVYTPPTRNPWDLERSAGGSSGGTGASVAAGIVAGGIGIGVTGAAVAGLAVPYVLRLSHRDPQVAAGPIALAAADMLTLLIYFNLARLLLA